MSGEAIYETRPCARFGEGPTRMIPGALHDTDTQTFTPSDFRFTCKGKVLYAIC
jgi:alpha-L-fucosidase